MFTTHSLPHGVWICISTFYRFSQKISCRTFREVFCLFTLYSYAFYFLLVGIFLTILIFHYSPISPGHWSVFSIQPSCCTQCTFFIDSHCRYPDVHTAVPVPPGVPDDPGDLPAGRELWPQGRPSQRCCHAKVHGSSALSHLQAEGSPTCQASILWQLILNLRLFPDIFQEHR